MIILIIIILIVSMSKGLYESRESLMKILYIQKEDVGDNIGIRIEDEEVESVLEEEDINSSEDEAEELIRRIHEK
ncbi:hypothetical protein D3C81_1245170 [compost metagenome]